MNGGRTADRQALTPYSSTDRRCWSRDASGMLVAHCRKAEKLAAIPVGTPLAGRPPDRSRLIRGRCPCSTQRRQGAESQGTEWFLHLASLRLCGFALIPCRKGDNYIRPSTRGHGVGPVVESNILKNARISPPGARSVGLAEARGAWRPSRASPRPARLGRPTMRSSARCRRFCPEMLSSSAPLPGQCGSMLRTRPAIVQREASGGAGRHVSRHCRINCNEVQMYRAGPGGERVGGRRRTPDGSGGGARAVVAAADHVATTLTGVSNPRLDPLGDGTDERSQVER